MSSIALDNLMAELRLELTVLEPQIRGMEDLLQVSLSADVKNPMQVELDDRKRRYSLIQNAIQALSNLMADGYPEMEKGELSAAAMAELEAQQADFDAAAAEFESIPPASVVSVELGLPVDNT